MVHRPERNSSWKTVGDFVTAFRLSEEFSHCYPVCGRALAVLALLFLFPPGVSFAQVSSSTGAIQGTVQDATGATVGRRDGYVDKSRSFFSETNKKPVGWLVQLFSASTRLGLSGGR